MAYYGRSPLRDLFDDAPTPHIAHPPKTHRRDYYVAADGSYDAGGGGVGAIIETGDGERLGRLARTDDSPDNNVAEYRALRLGLDELAGHAPETARVGVLVDHDDLAANVNAVALGMAHPDWPTATRVPEATTSQWQGITSRLRGFTEIRAACIPSDANPAHALANAPDEYRHVNEPTPDRDWEAPPPSRAERHAGD